MMNRCAGLLLVATLLFGFDVAPAAPESEPTAQFNDGQAMLMAAQTRAARKRRSRARRLRRSRQTATQTNKPDSQGQPVLRVINPAEDRMPPARPTPTPGMKNP